MKKVLIALAILVAVFIGFIIYVYTNLDNIVRLAIEQVGTEAAGSTVSVGEVSLNLPAGRASIYDFSVANPPGYSNMEMLSFGEFTVVVDLASLNQDLIRIREINSRDPFVNFERIDGVSNLETSAGRLAGGAPQDEQSDGPSGMPLQIDSIVIRNIRARLHDDLLPQPLEVSLGDITLENLSGTPEEISTQAMGPIIEQITSRAAAELLSSIAELRNISVEDLEAAAGETLQELEDSVNDTLNEGLGEDIREGIGNILRGD